MRDEVCAQSPSSGSLCGEPERNAVVGPSHAVVGPISEKKGENSLFLQGERVHNCQRWDKNGNPVRMVPSDRTCFQSPDPRNQLFTDGRVCDFVEPRHNLLRFADLVHTA